MKKTEYQQLLEYVSRGISSEHIARPTRDRTLLLGVSNQRSSIQWVHHVYLEDSQIHSVFYEVSGDNPNLMGHHYGTYLADNDPAWPSQGWFKYHPQYCDAAFCKEFMLRVQELSFTQWEEPAQKGPFFAKRFHEMDLPPLS